MNKMKVKRIIRFMKSKIDNIFINFFLNQILNKIEYTRLQIKKTEI